AGTARAIVVAPDFSRCPNHLLDLSGLSAAGHARLLQLALLLAQELFLDIIHAGLVTMLAISIASACGGWLANTRTISISTKIGTAATWSRPANRSTVSTDHLHKIQVASCVLLEALHHLFEHFERLALIFDKRIMLAVAAKTDAFAQVIHI